MDIHNDRTEEVRLKTDLPLKSIALLLSLATVLHSLEPDFYLKWSGRGLKGDLGVWASGTEVPQWGLGADPR